MISHVRLDVAEIGTGASDRRDAFIKDLKKVDGVSSTLAQIIERTRGIRVTLTKLGDTGAYLVIIKGAFDSLLVELGRQYGFPRGFPLVWYPNRTIYCFGFYPKFENDVHAQQADDTEFDGATNMTVTLKMSGFLGQFILFSSLDGKTLYSLYCSKNSSGNEFSDGATRIAAPWLTDDLAHKLWNDGLYFCGEVMSFNDQMHGDRVLSESFVVTCLGRIMTIDIQNHCCSRDTMSSYLSHDELMTYCLEHHMPVTSSWTCDQPQQIIDFVKVLGVQRDFMTNSKFDDLVGQHFTEHRGNVTHAQTLGDVLEGLVIKFTTSDGTRKTVKYKFPNYTHRTFFLRQSLGPAPTASVFFERTYLSALEKYLSRWVVSQEGKDYWRRRMMSLAVHLKNVPFPTRDVEANNQPGIHIQLADMDIPILEDANSQLLALMPPQLTATVIVFVGPVGYGKSTTAESLATSVGFRHIDGDLLGLDDNIVKLLGAERGDYTLYQIAKALIDGVVPVVSTGGAVIKNLKSYIKNLLGIDVDMVLFRPKGDDMATVYSASPVRDVVEHRINNGFWSLTKGQTLNALVDKISKVNIGNATIADELIQMADTVMTFPRATQGNDQDQTQDTTHFKPELSNFSTVAFKDMTIRPQQVRIVALVGDTTVGHITVAFSTNGINDFDFEAFDSLASSLTANKLKATIVTAPSSKKNKPVFSFAAVDDANIPSRANDEIHVTLKTTVHRPSEMKSACAQFRSDSDTITLKDKNGEETTHARQSLQLTDTTVKILGGLLIPVYR